VSQEESEHNEVDGMKKGVDSKGEVMLHSRLSSNLRLFLNNKSNCFRDWALSVLGS